MSHSNDKARRERAVFRDFAQRCGLSIVSGSIENREPPQPDIYCEIEGEGPMAFELAEFADESFAKEIAHVSKHPKTREKGIPGREKKSWTSWQTSLTTRPMTDPPLLT